MWQPTGSIALLKAYVRTKAAAKLLLFFDMTKFFARKMQIFLILRHIYDRLSLRNKNLTKQKLAMRARECSTAQQIVPLAG